MKKLLLLLVMMLSFVTNAQTFDFECAAAPLFRIGEVTRSIIQNRVTTLEVRGGVSEDIQWYSEASNGARTLIEDADDVTNDDISDDNRSYTILIDGPIGTRVTYLVPNGDDFIRFNINIVAPPIAPEIEVVQAIGGVNRIRVVFEGLNPTESYTTVISTGTSEIVRTPFTGNHVIDQEVSVTPVYGETFAVLLYRSSDLTTSLTDYRQPVSADPSFTVATATWNNLNEYTFRFNPVSIPRGAWIEINGNGRRIHRDNSARTIISDFFTIAGTVVLQLRGNNDTVYAEERLQLPTPGNGGIRAYINGSGFLRGAGWNVDGHIAPEGRYSAD